MNRYSNIKKVKNQNEVVGKLNAPYYTPVKYPEIKESENDIWVETEFGDRLDLLANQFYKDITLYWIIACANPDVVNMGSIFIPVGANLRIPTNTFDIINDYKVLNN